MKISNILLSTEGRIRRRDYWLYSIALQLGYLIIYLGVAVITGSKSDVLTTGLLLSLAMIWPVLCLQIKRWHDRNKSWVWIFINFIPIVGSIWSFVELGCLNGTKGRNSYGNSPKGLNLDNSSSVFERVVQK